VGLALAFHEGLQWGNLRHIDPSAEVPDSGLNKAGVNEQ
jgi:hypothetical protein